MGESGARNEPARDESAAGGVPLEELLAVLEAGVRQHREPVPAPAEEDGRSVVFRLGSTRCALPIDRVFEIAEVPRITPVPNLPPWVRGVANLRGDVLAVIDLRAFVGLAPFERGDLDGGDGRDGREGRSHRSGRLLVVRAAPGPLGQIAAGLWVDEVEGVTPVPRRELAPPDGSIDDRLGALLAGVLIRNGRPLAALDLDRFFATPELRALNAEVAGS
jgi:twitching motility protein PilI